MNTKLLFLPSRFARSLAVRIGLLSICGICSALPVHAEFKVATVDLNRILNESAQAKEQRKELDALSAEKKKALEAKKNSLSAREKTLKDKKVTEGSKEVQEFATDVKSFNQLVKESEDEIKKEFLRVNKSLTEKAMQIIKAYADKKNIDLVIDKGEKMRGPVLFGNADLDITDDVLKEINKAG